MFQNPLDTPISVLRRHNVWAFPQSSKKAKPVPQAVMTLGDALTMAHRTDAMLAGYHIRGYAHTWRLSKAILKMPKKVEAISYRAMFFDLDFDWSADAHKTGSWDSIEGRRWWADVLAKFYQLPEQGAWGLYPSRAGCRIYCVHALDIPLTIADRFHAMGWDVLANAGMNPDNSAKGWCHVMRAPHATRDGVVLQLRHAPIYPTTFLTMTPDDSPIDVLLAAQARLAADRAQSKAVKKRRNAAITAKSPNIKAGGNADQNEHLERICARVLFAPMGEHNATISKAAYECGGRAHLGMHQEGAVQAILGACASYYVPLMEVDGPFSAEGTIRRSMAQGRQRPMQTEVEVEKVRAPAGSKKILSAEILDVIRHLEWPVKLALTKVAKGIIEDATPERVEDAAYELGQYHGYGHLDRDLANIVVGLAAIAGGRAASSEAVDSQITEGANHPRPMRAVVSHPTQWAIELQAQMQKLPQYMPDINIFQQGRLLGVHAGLGTGKTQQLGQLFGQAEEMGANATYVAASRSLITDAVARFQAVGVDVGDYRDVGAVDGQLVAVCLPSLLRRPVQYGGLVALDEIEALRQLLFCDAIVKPKDQLKLFVHLTRMLRGASKVVVLDAHLTEDTMLWLSALVGVTPCKLQWAGWQTFEDVKMHGRPEDVEFIATKSLLAGNRIAVACATPKTVKRLQRRWQEMGYTVLGLHGESDAEDLNKTSAEWSNFDAIVYNPVMARGKTIGKDAQIDEVFLFAANVPGMAWKTLSQLVHRVRAPRCRTLHAYVDLRMESGPRDPMAIAAAQMARQSVTNSMMHQMLGPQYSQTIQIVPEHSEWIIAKVYSTVARNEMCADRYTGFVRSFTDKGIVVTTPSGACGDDAAADLRKQTRTILKTLKEEEIGDIVDAKDITTQEAQHIRDDHRSTPVERTQARRASIRDFYERNPTHELVESELKAQPQSAALRRLVDHCGVISDAPYLRQGVLDMTADGTPHPSMTERFLRPYLVWMILTVAGVDLGEATAKLAPEKAMKSRVVEQMINAVAFTMNPVYDEGASCSTRTRLKRVIEDKVVVEQPNELGAGGDWSNETLASSGLMELLDILAPILPRSLQPRKDVAQNPCRYIGSILRSMGLSTRSSRSGSSARTYSMDWDTQAVMLAMPHADRVLRPHAWQSSVDAFMAATHAASTHAASTHVATANAHTPGQKGLVEQVLDGISGHISSVLEQGELSFAGA